MRLWRLELEGEPDLVAQALVLAPDASKASEALMADVADWGDHPVQRVVAAHQVLEPPEILDLHMSDPDRKLAASAPPTVPQIWKVTHHDGLFHRSEGASLVVADNADAAVETVAAADPFEGRPPYGVPAEYGPAERFNPEDPYVIWIELDWLDVGKHDQ